MAVKVELEETDFCLSHPALEGRMEVKSESQKCWKKRKSRSWRMVGTAT